MPTVGPDLPPLSPSREEFRALAGRGNVVPVYAELAADLDTPLSAFLRIGQARLSAGTFDQHAALPLLRLGKDYYDRVVGEYRHRRDTLVEALQMIPGLRCQKPEGAFYLLADLPVDDSDKFCAWLLSDFSYEGATVMLAPANGFYATPGKGLTEVRIAYIVNTDRLRQGVRVLQRALAQYPGRRGA